MYKIKKMKLKSIIKNGEETSTVEIEGNGTIRIEGDTTSFYLDHGTDHYEFTFRGDTLKLIQNRSKLNMVLNKKVSNEYHTAYGMLLLDSILEKVEYNDRGMKIMYDLYQDDSKISRVYMVIITL